MILRIALVWFVFFATAINVIAQDGEDNDGEIEDVEIKIVKDRQITLPKVNRNFKKIPPLNVRKDKREVEYFFTALDFDLPDLSVRIRPLRMKNEVNKKLYGNYLKAGFGNYSTSYVEAYVNNKRSKTHSYGAHFNFLNSGKGPVDDKNSGSGMLDLDLFGKIFSPKATISGNTGIRRRNMRFYGYPENATDINLDNIKQHFNDVYVSASIENTNKSKAFQYFTGATFDYLSDNYEASESELQLDFKSSYKLGEVSRVNLVSDLDIITQKDDLISAKARNIFRVSPTFTFDYKGFLLDAGFNAVFENDTLSDSDELHFYPLVRASYTLDNSFNVHAGIRGDIIKNSLRELTNENPFLLANTPAYNQNKTFEIYGGIKGKLSSKMSFGAGVSAANIKNMYFFVNNAVDQSRFNAVYDTDNTGIFNVFGEFSYNNDDKLRLALRGDVYTYTVSTVVEAWHKPNFRLNFLSTYKLYDKFLFGADLIAIGGMQALDTSSGDAVNLKSAIDLNLNTEYLISEQISAFVRFNNIFSQEYELLLNYPSRKLQFMIGATYNF